MNKPNITGSIVLKVVIDGKPYSVVKDLPDAVRHAYGPMALEGGCFLALQEACQEIMDRVKYERN